MVLRLTHFFRTIFVLYYVNVLIFPLFHLGSLLWDLWRQRGKASHARGSASRRWVFAIRGGGSVLLLSLFGYATFLEPQALRIETIEVFSPHVTDELTLLHISDIQAASLGRYEQRVFRHMQQLQPDLILHTGDLLQPYFFKDLAQEQDSLARLFRTLQPRYGIFHVVGDVDLPRITPAQFDAQAGITTLENQHYLIHTHAGTLNLLGLTLAASRTGNRPLITHWLQHSPSQAFTILLGHAPDYVLDVQDHAIDLCLAGHTHGGQIRLPSWGPLVTLSRVPKDWAMGYRQLPTLRLNVSAGIGAEHASQLPSIRINCPPTMTVFFLKPLPHESSSKKEIKTFDKVSKHGKLRKT